MCVTPHARWTGRHDWLKSPEEGYIYIYIYIYIYMTELGIKYYCVQQTARERYSGLFATCEHAED